ncbi:uncharacterized mitochondrial protein-like protein [Tanacetum coccineum]
MDVKSTFLYGKIKEEVYVCQPPGFKDPDFPDKVHKVEKALYGLHQAPRAWYETLSTYLLDNEFQKGKIDKTLFIKRYKGDILLVKVYVDDTIFGSIKKELCNAFENQDKYVDEILKKFGFTEVKTASTPIETPKPLLKDEDGEEVDVHLYRSMIGSLIYLTSSRPDIMFALCACARYQVNPKVSHNHVVKRIFSAKTTAWNELSSTMNSAIICLATNQNFNFSKYIFESMVKNLDNVNKFLMYPRFVQVFLDQQVGEMSTHNRIYVTPSHTKKIFRKMRRVGKGFSRRETPLFQTMVVQDQADMGEGSAIPTDPHHTPTISQPSTSQPKMKQRPRKCLDAEQDRGNINKTRSKAIPNEPISPGTSSGGGPRHQDTMRDNIAQTRSENVSKTSNDPLLVRGNILQSGEDSLKLKQLMEFCTKLQQRVLDLENTKTVQSQEITSLKLRVKKLENKGGSRTHKLKILYKVRLSRRVESSDEASLGDQEDASKQWRKIDDTDKYVEITLDMAEKEINVAEKEVSTADPVTTAGEVVTTAGEVVTTASVEVSTASPTEATIADELTLAQTLIEIRSAKPKIKRVVIGEQSESTTRAKPQQLLSKDKDYKLKKKKKQDLQEKKAEKEQEANVALIEEWNDIQAKIEADQLLAKRLQAREQEELTIEERSILFQQLLEKRSKYFAAKRAEEKRNKPPTKAQQKSIMCTYLKNMKGWKPKDLKSKSFANIQELFDKAMKMVNTFVDFRTELVEESSSKRAGDELEQESIKKQKVDEDTETAELQSLMQVIPYEEEVAIDATPLATKPPTIIDWKIHKEGKISYYQIIRADGSLKMYRIFSQMLKSFDRKDLEDLYKLVKAKYGSTRPMEDLDLILYGDLKTMFDPHVEDQVWKNQHDYRVLDWKLYDSCGVYSLMMQHVYIHMLVEKRYPLTPATITDMLNRKLQADHWNKMFYQLFKLITK